MTTAGQRLRRRRGNMPGSTEWSGLSSAVARSQRKWRKSAASSSCRCARWALPQAVCHMTNRGPVMWLQRSACSLCSSTCWRWMRSMWRKVWISCKASSSISTPSASTYGGGLRLRQLSRILHVWDSFYEEQDPQLCRELQRCQKWHQVTVSLLQFPSVMFRRLGVIFRLSSLGAHPEGEIK